MNESVKPNVKEPCTCTPHHKDPECGCGCNSKPLGGTATEKNLANAYISESCAVTRYTFFAKCADKESYFEVANIFRETAANELHHAKIFLKYLSAGSVLSTPISIDAGVLSPTVANLGVAIEEERTEGVDTYMAAAKVAEQEGFHEIAQRFVDIATVEQHHKERFQHLRQHVENGTMWHRDKPTRWVCLVCGYVMEGTEPPNVCPACKHPYQHFKADCD
jgi:rubrerythrin